MKVVILAGVAPSTIFTHVPIATALRNAGHQVMMTTSIDAMLPVITQVGLSSVPITNPDLTPRQVIAAAGLARVPEDPIERERLSGQWWARLEAVTLDALLAFAREWQPDVVIGGTNAYAAPLLAAHLGIPWVRHTWDIHDPELMDAGAADELREELAAVGLDGIPEPDMVIDIAPPSLRPPGVTPGQPMRWIPGNAPARLEPWMYTRPDGPRVGVTIGTGVAEYHQYDFLQGILDHVTTLDAEIVVPVTEDAIPVLSERLQSNVRAGWIPLDVLAPTLDVLVHQSGGSTMMTALSCGVPQVLIPDPGLHRANAMARGIAEAGAGIVLTPEEATTDVIAKHCQEILSNPAFAAAAAGIAREIAAMPSPDEVARRVESLVREVPEIG